LRRFEIAGEDMHFAAEKIRQAITAGRPTFGTILSEFSGPNILEILGNVGCDFAVVDCEHGNFTPREVEQAVEAGYHNQVATIVRPPSVDRGFITRSLDAGAAGVMIPFCSSIDEVRAAVQFSKYKPIGQRGIHLMRAHTRHRRPEPVKYMAEANESNLTIIQIELTAAVELAPQLAAIPGVDCLYIGPADLCVDMGIDWDLNAPAMVDAIRRTAKACQDHGKMFGCHCSSMQEMALLVDHGVQMCGYSCDIDILQKVMHEHVSGFSSIVNSKSVNTKAAAD
jgi:4-hydroxy-2-oxoheptanedioate aldolase